MELSEMQARAAELEQQISALPAGSVTKKTVSGKDYFTIRWIGRTRSGGRSIFLLTNWRISARRSSGGRNWSRS